MTTDTDSCHGVEVRTARETDLPGALALLGQAQLPTAGVEDAFSQFIIAESEGRLVGVVGLEIYGASALLRSAAVEQRWRSTGIGRALIERALDAARQRGIEDVFLLTTTAEHYFPRFGFAAISRESVGAEVQCSVEFQEACPASAVVMRKRLKAEAR